MPDIATLTASTPAGDQVHIWASRSRHSLWHTDRACPTLRRQGVDPIDFLCANSALGSCMWTHNRLSPCGHCAADLIAYTALTDSGEDVPDRVPVVLGCPKMRLGFDDGHARCRVCPKLRTLAGRTGMLEVRLPDGYQLAAGTVARDRLWDVQYSYAVHLVPDGAGPVTAELLTAAFTLSAAEHGEKNALNTQLPCWSRRNTANGTCETIGLPAWRLAGLVTAHPAT